MLYEKNPYGSGAATIPSYCNAMEKRMIRGDSMARNILQGAKGPALLTK
ncbi:MAG: hypothetical protein ABFD82_07435 [Syntrophaceae bacterium]